MHSPSADEDLLPCEDSRSTPRSMSALKRYPQVATPTPQKVLGPEIFYRGMPRGPIVIHMGTGYS